MAKVKSFFISHKVFFGLFLFLLVYEAAVGNNLAPWRILKEFITFYTVDYSLGFCSRFLPGAVYRLFFSETDPDILSAVSVCLLLLFFAALCVLLEKLVLRAPKGDRALCLFFVLLFITGPASFSLFVQGMGVIDVYWVYLTLLCFLCLMRRWAYPVIPVLFVAAVFVHFGAMLCYVPMMALAVLYKISVTETKKDRGLLWTVLGIGVVAAIGFTLFFMLFEHRTLTLPQEEFDALLVSRGATYTDYYDFNLYKSYSQSVADSAEGYVYEDGSFIVTLLRTVMTQIRTTMINRFHGGITVDYLVALLLLFPVAVLLISVFLSRFAAEKGKRNFCSRTVYLLVPLLFVGAALSSFLASSDTFRWLTHTFVPMLGMFLYISYYEGSSFWQTVRCRISSVPIPVLAVYLVVYAAVTPAG